MNVIDALSHVSLFGIDCRSQSPVLCKHPSFIHAPLATRHLAVVPWLERRAGPGSQGRCSIRRPSNHRKGSLFTKYSYIRIHASRWFDGIEKLSHGAQTSAGCPCSLLLPSPECTLFFAQRQTSSSTRHRTCESLCVALVRDSAKNPPAQVPGCLRHEKPRDAVVKAVCDCSSQRSALAAGP